MKLVVTSDWHLDHVTHGVSRHEELKRLVNIVVDRAIEEVAEGFLFLGDLCDPDSGSTVFRCVEVAVQAADRLARRGVSSVWMAGNHDVIEDNTGDTTISPLRALSSPLVHVVERPGVVMLDDLAIIGLPFTATSHGYEPEKFLASTERHAQEIVIGHLNVPGVIPGEETTEMPRGREVTFPTDSARARAKLVLNGHYHRQQRTLSGVWIPGSLARLTFGEESYEPGYLVLEV